MFYLSLSHFKGIYARIILNTATWTTGMHMAKIISKSKASCELSIDQEMATVVAAVLAHFQSC